MGVRRSDAIDVDRNWANVRVNASGRKKSFPQIRSGVIIISEFFVTCCWRHSVTSVVHVLVLKDMAPLKKNGIDIELT